MAGSRPLRILVHTPLGYGGVTTLMTEIQSGLDREQLNFDYIVFHDALEPREKMVLDMGSKKLVAAADYISFRPLRGLVRFFVIQRVCRKNHVRIFHFNGGAPMGFVTMLAAKLGGVKWVTFHSHNGGMSNEGRLAVLVSRICKPLLPLVADDFWACSALAANFSFPKSIVENKKYYFMPNAIDLERFAYNEEARARVRREMGWDGHYVIGHAGRFNHQKNHGFLIDIFAEIAKMDENALLVLFGEGELLEPVKEKVRALGLETRVSFCGTSEQMDQMYQGMDVFLLPSCFEGLPVVGVEAQAAGLPIVFADTITREVAVSNHVVYLPLSDSPKIWAEQVLSMKASLRYNCIDALRKAGFDRKEMIQHFQQYYLDIGKKLGLV